MSADERPVSRAAKIASLLLALLPPARMAWIVFSNGENNLSNDYVAAFPSSPRCSTGTALWEGSSGGKEIILSLSAEETHEGETPLVFEAPRVLFVLGEAKDGPGR